jgi:hypothetical protein
LHDIQMNDEIIVKQQNSISFFLKMFLYRTDGKSTVRFLKIISEK